VQLFADCRISRYAHVGRPYGSVGRCGDEGVALGFRVFVAAGGVVPFGSVVVEDTVARGTHRARCIYIMIVLPDVGNRRKAHS
jgi:hypothetical protein